MPKKRDDSGGEIGPRGLRGRTGPKGPVGAAGPPGEDHAADIAVLAEQVALVIKELQTQLTRIAQIQAQLDRLAARQDATVLGRQRKRSRTDSEG